MEEQTTVQRGNRKERTGIVESDCQNKTIVVRVSRRVAHPLYKKVVKSSKTYHVHDEENTAKKGDFVRIVETRPISKLKRWRLIEVISRAE